MAGRHIGLGLAEEEYETSSTFEASFPTRKNGLLTQIYIDYDKVLLTHIIGNIYKGAFNGRFIYVIDRGEDKILVASWRQEERLMLLEQAYKNGSYLISEDRSILYLVDMEKYELEEWKRVENIDDEVYEIKRNDETIFCRLEVDNTGTEFPRFLMSLEA